MANPRADKALRFLEQVGARHSGDARAGGLEALRTAAPAGEAPVAGFETLPAHEKVLAETVSAKIREGRPLEDRAETFALEAIIIPDKRPAVDVIKGDFKVDHPLWRHLNQAAPRKRLRQAVASIGRIELPGHPSIPYGGTGFVVGPNLLMTNRHVAELFTSGVGKQGLAFLPGVEAGVDFRQELGSTQKRFFQVRKTLLVHPYWDMALLRVEGLEAELPLTLSLLDPDEAKNRDVAVIGYPAFDPRNDAMVQNRVFRGVYNVKRLQPGKLTGRRKVSSFGKTLSAATHDSSTLGGNSGSAVVDVATGAVLALHFGGLYLDANFGVPACDLARDGRLQDLGLNFQPPGGTARAGAWDTWWGRAGPGEAPAEDDAVGTGDGGPIVATSPKPQGTGGLAPGQSVTWTLPLSVTVSLGAASVMAGAPVVEITEKMAEPVHDGPEVKRGGYNPSFLGKAVPVPEPVDKTLLATLEDGGWLIPYHHFSLAMHKRRRLALFTAANVDASPARKKPEPGDYRRDALGGLGESDVEKWFPDPRLRGQDQLPDRFFTKDKGAFDKGHLVRREDVAWGLSYAEVQAANGDTYHTTNCSPQVAGFNRANGQDNWGELENVVLRQAKTQKVSVFSGPVLADDDRVFSGVDDLGGLKLPIPRAYWKVVVAVDGGKLRAFAFVLEQDLSNTPLEFQVNAEWRARMISLNALQKRLKLVRFPKVMHDADQSGTEAAAAVESVAGLGA